VTSAVQQTAEEVVKTVKETDWKSEIVEFSREVQVDAQTVGVSTATAVQHLPEQVNGLLERGAEGEVRVLPSSAAPAPRRMDCNPPWVAQPLPPPPPFRRRGHARCLPMQDHQPLPSVEQLLDPDQVGKALGDVGTSISSWGQQFIRGARDMLDEVGGRAQPARAAGHSRHARLGSRGSRARRFMPTTSCPPLPAWPAARPKGQPTVLWCSGLYG
jgi:hypothetical protein